MQTDFAQCLFDSITDSAVLLDKMGRIVDWNPGATTLFGYPKKEVIGRSINLVYEQNHPFFKILHETLPEQKKWFAETRYIRKNGSKGVCKTSAVLLPQHQQHKAIALLTHHNVSPYKALEQELQNKNTQIIQNFHQHLEHATLTHALFIRNLNAAEQIQKTLRESELRFHLLAENATDIISRHTSDGMYLYVSPSSKTLLGYSPEELIGSNAYRYLHHDDIPKLKKVFNRRKDVTSQHTVTYRIRRKDGEYRWFESNIRIIRDETTKMVREIQSASRDVTDRILDKKARLRGQQLAHVFRLSSMEEMASGMAHEISQPLAAIVNYTQGCVRYLQKESHDPQQLIEIMKKAVSQAERAGEVIHRLKNFFCKGKLFKTPCKLNSLIRETVGLIRNDLNNSKTKIDFDIEKNIQLISVDKIQIQQVILNLIQNAIEAMKEVDPRKRHIHIKASCFNNNVVHVVFTDSGPGFSKELIHKVFEPFFTTKAHGRGMGLAICRSIIEAHGGLFTINPNNNGRSWIQFTLPFN